jgi:hypothetical protein
MKRQSTLFALLGILWICIESIHSTGALADGCQQLKIEFAGEGSARAELRLRMLIDRVNVLIASDIVPPNVTARLSFSNDVRAEGSAEGDGRMQVPNRYYNHIIDGDGESGTFVAKTLLDTDAVITHEYGHLIFAQALIVRGNPRQAEFRLETAKMVEQVDAMVPEISRLQEIVTPYKKELADQRLGPEFLEQERRVNQECNAAFQARMQELIRLRRLFHGSVPGPLGFCQSFFS